MYFFLNNNFKELLFPFPASWDGTFYSIQFISSNLLIWRRFLLFVTVANFLQILFRVSYSI